MKISIISATQGSKQSKAGKSYQNLEVIYKNLDQGKVENKNITQYNDAFKVLANAAPGQVYDVVSQKNDAGFWEWISVVRDVSGVVSTPAVTQTAAPAASKGNWETAEERAAKQVFIIKQSSLSTAAAVLAIGAKTAPTAASVIEMAQVFTDFVLGTKDIFEQDNDLEVE